MTRTVLVAGASGALGSHVVRALAARGWRVRAMSRRPSRLQHLGGEVVEEYTADALDPRTLRGACDRVDAVFSCIGASVRPGLARGWRSYAAVDTPANLNLLSAASRAGVKRFMYVSTHHTSAMASLPYVRAHEAVVEALRASGLDYTVVRPTGFFSTLDTLLDAARRGPLPEVGDGSARSNPIADADLASLCAELLDADRREVSAGGPDVLSRRAMGELAFAAVGRLPFFVPAPPALARAGSLMLRPLHPRMAQLTAFLTELSTQDVIAPALGTHRLVDYFAERAKAPPVQAYLPSAYG